MQVKITKKEKPVIRFANLECGQWYWNGESKLQIKLSNNSECKCFDIETGKVIDCYHGEEVTPVSSLEITAM